MLEPKSWCLSSYFTFFFFFFFCVCFIYNLGWLLRKFHNGLALFFNPLFCKTFNLILFQFCNVLWRWVCKSKYIKNNIMFIYNPFLGSGYLITNNYLVEQCQRLFHLHWHRMIELLASCMLALHLQVLSQSMDF